MKIKSFFANFYQHLPKLLAVVTALAFFSMFAAVLYPAWYSQSFQLRQDTVVTEPIVADKRILDEVATEKARAAAEAKVKPVYEQVNLEPIGLVAELMQKINDINNERLTDEIKAQMYKNELFPESYISYYERQLLIQKGIDPGRFTTAFRAEIMKTLKSNAYTTMPFEVYYKLPLLSSDELLTMENVMIELLPELYKQPLAQVTTARDKLVRLVTLTDLPSSTQRELTIELLRYVLAPNSFVNSDSTKALKLEVREAVVDRWIEKGTVIVPQGKVLNEQLYDKLVKLDLVHIGNPWLPHFGIWLFAGMLVFLMFLIMYPKLKWSGDMKEILMVMAIFLIAVVLLLASDIFKDDFSYNPGYVVPLAFAGVMIALLHQTRSAYVALLALSILAAAQFHGDQVLFDFRYGLYTLVTGAVAIAVAQKVTERSSMLRSGLYVAVAGAALQITFGLLDGTNDHAWWVLEASIFSTINGILTMLLVLGLMPIFETVFNILSHLKLIELKNHNHPLLQRLMKEASGTYHHSMMVANLAAAAAERVGANSLLCEVSAYYHDVGKLTRPSFFIENHTQDYNPHDLLDPNVSKAMIIAHVTDGIELLRKAKTPKLIIDIISQHHGTTVIFYFYKKALEEQENDQKRTVDMNQFRYPGPKPQTLEAVILLLADSIEATVRSKKQVSSEEIDRTVEQIIKGKLDDKQFNECNVTMKQLEEIGNVMKQMLRGSIHKRIDYTKELKQAGEKSND